MAVPRNPKYVDPTMEHLNSIVDALMATETKRLKNVLHDLLVRNHSLGGSQDAFIHGGKLFHLIPRRFLRNVQVKTVHTSLSDEAEILKQSYDNVQHDTRRLRQGMAVVLRECRSKQDLRDVLPETLATAIPDFQGMDRTREEGFVLDHKPLLKRQYQQVVNLALYYQANQLIY